MQPGSGELYLGGVIDPETGERTETPMLLDSDDLTTHGVVVGMTGSGKTGLGMVLIEEALLSGLPCLVIDPKGDMGNLVLQFPDFEPDRFRPWVEASADGDGSSVDDVAAQTAETWREGLASWDVSDDRLLQMASIPKTIYTPGSSAGVPLNVLGSLAAPETSFETDPETFRAEIEGYVQSLLTLADVQSDPVSGREHILMATIIEHSWAAGEDLDLAGLIGSIQKPGFRKLGVFELDSFFPPDDRAELAMRLNGVVASPSFASWMEGAPIDIDALLGSGSEPRAAIITISHLSEPERQFVVTLLLSKLVTWMRSQSGTSDLRALVYMDEVFGFAPPTAEPPSKKPILTIMKQARAFGVGMVLATQNPVDLDYKTMSNAGTWMVGRLQTERDKARVLEGIESAAGGVDVAGYDDRISGLDKRQFVLVSAKRDAPLTFGTRWAMSYLAGPLTRDEIRGLTPDQPAQPSTESTPVQPGESMEAPVGQPARELGGDETPVAPTVADGVEVAWVEPQAPWLSGLGLQATSGEDGNAALIPGAAATVSLLYDDQHADVAHRETYEAVITPLTPTVTETNLHSVDHDPRDFVDQPPPGAVYRLPDAPVENKGFWSELERSLESQLVGAKTLSVFKCPELKLYSRVGETHEEFAQRCAAAAEAAADEEIAALKDKYETKIERVRSRISTAERRAEELSVDVDTRKQQELFSGAGDLLGAILGGRRSSGAISRAARRRGHTRRTQERLESAEAKVSDQMAELASLEDELEDDVIDITDRWTEAAETIEEITIPLEKSDIEVTSLNLIWLPTTRASHPAD